MNIKKEKKEDENLQTNVVTAIVALFMSVQTVEQLP
jgi:hypothetical protein